MADIYDSFAALEASEREGSHWRHEYLPRASRVLVMAPHGGWIEPFTSEVARAVAGVEFSCAADRAAFLAGASPAPAVDQSAG